MAMTMLKEGDFLKAFGNSKRADAPLEATGMLGTPGLTHGRR